jgi:hypothetical protein
MLRMVWVQIIVVAVLVVALVYGLWLQRAQLESAREAGAAARDTARLSLQAAELQAEAIQAARAAVEAAARIQRLAARPVLKIGLSVQGLTSDVGRTPVVFALRLQNVGHGTAVIEQVALRVRGAPAASYGGDSAETPADLGRRIETEVFQRAVGASLQALSGTLAVTALTDDARALEAAGAFDLLRVQVFAHNADAVEQGFETLSAVVSYRDLDGGHYTSADQFRSLQRIKES